MITFLFKYFLPVSFWIFCIIPAVGQEFMSGDTVFNHTDEMGMKQGYWIKKDDQGSLIYRGFFKDNFPIGEFIRYYKDGTVKSRMNYLPDRKTVEVKHYYANGKLAAEGRYYIQKKDGEWRYYSFYEDFLSYREQYNHGVKEGESIKYYPDGKVAEVLNWENGQKHGKWLQYFPDGGPKLEAHYVKNKLNGPFVVYHLNGKKEIEGIYKNDLRDSVWHTYDLLGNLKATITYTNGIADNEDEITRQQMHLLDSLENNKGKFAEPDLNSIDFHKR